MSATALAWLLEFADGSRAAVGLGELVHLLAEPPRLFPVPGAPPWCRQVALWQNEPAPVLDLGAWAGGSPAQGQVLAIVAYQNGAEGRARHAALSLGGVPRRVPVTAQAAVGPQELAPPWRRIAHSAFRLGDSVVPILDLDRLFGGEDALRAKESPASGMAKETGH